METSAASNNEITKFPWRIRLGTVLGFPFYIHCSFFLWFFLLFWVEKTDLVLFISLLVFSISIHELAHALTCRALGFGGGTLTIWFFGGYFMPFSQISLFDMNRVQRFRYAWMILAGPLSNLVLAGIFISLAYLTSMDMLYVAARYNLSLAILNLLPAGRLDGGSILMYLGSTVMSWRKVTLLAGALSLAFAVVTFAGIFFTHWISRYSNWAGFFISMGISTIQTSRKSEEEIRAESQKQVADEIAFVESNVKTSSRIPAYFLIPALLSMLLFSLWHVVSEYVTFRDLPGRIIYVDRNQDHDTNLYITKGMGFPTVKVSRNLYYMSQNVSFSKDGQIIAFGCFSSQNAELMALCIADSRGSHIKELFLNGNSRFESLLVAPSGKKVAFSTSENVVFVVDITTAVAKRFEINGEVETWSPDETSILLTREIEGQYEIFRINLWDSSVKNITNHSEDDFSPAYSRAGKQIYFVSTRSTGKSLYRMDADGLNPLRVRRIDTLYQNSSFKLSPDQSKITFACGEMGGYVCVAPITNSNKSKQIGEGRSPVWSPDSKYIAYSSSYDSNAVFVFQLENKQIFKVKSPNAWVVHLDWLP